MAPKTLDEYLNEASGLLNWMQRSGRIPANPLKAVGKVEMRGPETRRRRADGYHAPDACRACVGGGVHRFIEISAGIIVGLLLSALWPDRQTNPVKI